MALHFNHSEVEPDNIPESIVMSAFRRTFGQRQHDGPQVVYEHGRTWVTCGPCGAQWSVVRDDGVISFEEVSTGDESCPGKK